QGPLFTTHPRGSITETVRVAGRLTNRPACGQAGVVGAPSDNPAGRPARQPYRASVIMAEWSLLAPVLSSEPVQEQLHYLHVFGDFENLLEIGENPLASHKPTEDLVRVLDATRHELSADLDCVLAAANAGGTLATLSDLARTGIDRHDV